MKTFIYGLVFSFCGLTLSAKTDSNHKFTYTIKGEIEGLVKGDTICFEKIDLPRLDRERAIHVIVMDDGEFLFEGSSFHSSYFLMTYKPLSGEKIDSDKMGMTLIADSSALLLKGNVEDIYYCEVAGGFYDHADMREITALSNALGKGRAAYRRQVMEARASGDVDKAKEYVEKFNSYAATNRSEYDKLRQLETDFAQKYPSAEWNIIKRILRVINTPLDELNAYYASMDEQAQKGYYGMLLRQEIDNMEMLTSGNDAPDFMLETPDGRRITLSDYAGSYLLIYHFGSCMGSISIDREVTSFYLKHKDKVNILSITEDISLIKKQYESAAPSDKIMGIDMKPALESMTSHPWTDVENKGDNRQLAIDYAFGGLPYFVFISPDGKILSRGFRETFYEAKKILEEAASK